jgi:hypothetical protein
VVLVTAFAGSSAARAAPEPPPPPPPDSGISQYVEQVPSSGGAKAPGISKRTKMRLPKHLEKMVVREGGSDASLLNEIATASDLGAPNARSQARAGRPQSKQANPKTTEVAIARTSTSDGASRTPLFIALAVALAATAALVFWRFRVRRAPPSVDL